MKKFNTRDSMGMELLLKNGIKTILMTRENSQIVRERVKKIQIVDLYSDVQKKEETLPELLKKYNVSQDEIEAFAKNISSELLRHADKESALEMLRKANSTTELRDKLGNLLSPNLVGYLNAWDFNTRHPVIKKLLKKTYFYIQNSWHKYRSVV